MRVKRIFVLAGVVALMGLLWATPAVADSHLPSITLDPASVPAEAGDVTITVSGSNWTEPTPFYVTACTGAQGDPSPLVDVTGVLANCPTITGDFRDVTWDNGSFTTEVTFTITQAEIDAGGLVILAGWLSASATSEDAAVAILTIVDEEAAAAAAERAAAEEAAEAAAAAAEEAAAAAEEAAAAAADEMPVTGAESNLLVVVGASILAAGLLVIGAGRRVRTATR